ncbi:MAG: hypothetical protein KI790_17510 [Cyclobacteriaceae bacterium]|nr:hypothetical protein [Cyclobacteriaceae bacterium HetDA_MAG_MS6]
MKNLLLMIICVLVLIACEDGEHITSVDPVLLGRWVLTEQLVDPGDGSGKFHQVESSKYIEFFADSTYRSNGVICLMSTETSGLETGRYDPKEFLILPDICPVDGGPTWRKIWYAFENDDLILRYTCIEPCLHKYKKVQIEK